MLEDQNHGVYLHSRVDQRCSQQCLGFVVPQSLHRPLTRRATGGTGHQQPSSSDHSRNQSNRRRRSRLSQPARPTKVSGNDWGYQQLKHSPPSLTRHLQAMLAHTGTAINQRRPHRLLLSSPDSIRPTPKDITPIT